MPPPTEPRGRHSCLPKSKVDMKAALLVLVLATADAFTTTTLARRRCLPLVSNNGLILGSTSEPIEYIESNHRIFMKLILSKENTNVWKKLSDSVEGYTIFAPNDEALSALGEKRLNQLADVRNRETTDKIGAYHCVPEPVSSEALFQSGGVVTLGGVVDVDRSISGGFFGLGGKEDGGVSVNGAKIVSTHMVGKCTIHEVDKLISPELLWRYMDQLRIPGSK